MSIYPIPKDAQERPSKAAEPLFFVCLLCSQQKARCWQRRGIRGYILGTWKSYTGKSSPKKSQAMWCLRESSANLCNTLWFVFCECSHTPCHRKHVEILGVMSSWWLFQCVMGKMQISIKTNSMTMPSICMILMKVYFEICPAECVNGCVYACST